IALVAAAEQGSAGPAWVNVAASSTTTQDLELTSGAGMLVGRVVDQSNGYPVGNATVGFGSQTALTDGHGFYAFTGVGTNPSGAVSVSRSDYSAASEEIRGGQADRTEMLTTKFFTLRPTVDTGTSLGGVVRDIDTTDPLGGVIITLSRPSDPAFQPLKAQTNLGGVWRFYNIPTGTYNVEARRPGYGTELQFAVVNTRDGVLAIFLTQDEAQTIDITGRVFDENGTTPLGNVSVVASSGIFGTVSAITDGTGNFLLEDLVIDAPYTIFFRPPTPSSGAQVNLAQTVVVSPPSAGLFLSVALPRNDTGAIIGKVTKTGQTTPPVGALVEAEKVGEPGSGEVFSTRVNSNGTYGLNGLPAGKYILRASFEGPNGLETFSFTGSTDVTAGQITKRNITFP
ncbi:MAG TPA: carboxypeptidase regulatory-like domain-containing protein, partial [bacterium]|nr:carboxypeptidase regulatory-like domain-containing protein [bacterium]